MTSKDIVIKVENISKCYRIGLKENMNEDFARTIFDFMRSPLKNYRKYRSLYKFDDIDPDSDSDLKTNSSDIIWALKDVSFEVKRGELLGIIGTNGAGKSTLLKILSRITVPTTGRAQIRGRISSLLEVGTGFHPELTGRENIYLNGTVLGMRKAEIDRNFDAIVDFSGVEKFIDTPVKRYSSGMRVRLAFAVSAHLEPEILLVDEVLAVGDIDFQKKCLNKMENAGRQGRTVLFVSHNMTAVTRLCTRAVLLDGGRVLEDGPSHRVVSAYLNRGTGTTAVREWSNLEEAPGNNLVRLCAVRVRTENGRIADTVDIRQPVGLEMEYEVLKAERVLLPAYNLFNEEGIRVFGVVDLDPSWRGRQRLPGRYISVAWIPGNLLSEGTMFVSPAIKTTAQVQDIFIYEHSPVAFRVIDNMDGDSARGDYAGRLGGVVRPLLKWETKFCPNGSKSAATIITEQKQQ
ncbi:MAG: ABC transporter ATP-binding protein [Pseudomonadota bacterium]